MALGAMVQPVLRRRRCFALLVVRAYAARGGGVEGRILLGCVLGRLSRRVAAAPLLTLVEPLVAGGVVSVEAKQEAAAVAFYHRRLLDDHCRLLLLDVVLSRSTGAAGVVGRPLLVPVGRRDDGEEEIVFFRLTTEGAAAGEWLLGVGIRLGRRGKGVGLECLDVDSGLVPLVPSALPGLGLHGCWARAIRIRMITDRFAAEVAIKAGLLGR